MTGRGSCAVMLAALWLAACTSLPSAVPASKGAATPSADSGAAPVDPSDDWHVLMRAPLGTSLQAMPFSLHEVLLFHDADRDVADVRDCYGVDGAAPRFLGAAADQYLLCFEHDRLTRVDASVPLPADDAPAIFARACALWQEHAPVAGAPVPAGTCGGRDHGVIFSARLEGGADEGSGRVSITLGAVTDP
jgi:hypothetical protein